jgi:hypothetical protein
MKLTALLLLSSFAFGASIPPARVTRASVAAMEDSLDNHIMRLRIDAPFYLVGGSRGMYVDGYGVMFAVELNLVATNLVSLFRPKVTQDELLKLKHEKEQRLPVLRQAMRQILIDSAGSLDGVPPTENISIGVTLVYQQWEESGGLPRQIVMQAPKKILMEAAKGNPAALDAGGLKVQEFN